MYIEIYNNIKVIASIFILHVMVIMYMYLGYLQVLNLSADVLKRIPDPIDYEGTAKLVADDMNPLNVVLLQEVQRCK